VSLIEHASRHELTSKPSPYPLPLASRTRFLRTVVSPLAIMSLARPSNAKAPVLSHFSLKGKKAAVTGGARGIGLEVVRGLAEAGADVALIYTSSKNAEETADKISKDTGVTVTAYKSDVKDKDAITATLNQVSSDFGRLDICVANAGIASHYDSLEYTAEQWRDIMDVNLDGAYYTAQAAGNIFKRQGPGAASMIFTASVSAILVNIPQRQAAYNASKAAVVHLAKSLAVEWTEFARVNCISPGFIETDMIGSLPKEWSETWPSLIPGRRFCDPAELKGVSMTYSPSSSPLLSHTCRRMYTLPATHPHT
jgi:sorbose reductase